MTATEHAGIGTQDLGGTFALRSAGAGKLMRRPAPERGEPGADSTIAARKPATEQITTPSDNKHGDTHPKPPGAVKKAADASKASAETPRAETKKQIIAYIPPALTKRLREQAASTGRTHLQLVMDALEATHSRLGELLTKAGYTEARASDLFGASVQSVSRRPARRGADQVSLRPSVSVLRVMDALVKQHSAPNRSILIEVALDSYLPASK